MVKSIVEFFFISLTLELEVVSEELAEARDFFVRGCKYSMVTGSDEYGRRVSLGIPSVSHVLLMDRVVFGGDVVVGTV